MTLRWLELVALSLCILCIGIAVTILFSGRSLWFDEAMLVWSIETRSLSSLASSPLAWNQTAPILYVYLLKFQTLLFGHSEAAYRLPSTISFALLPLLTWFIAKNAFHIPCPWVCAAFVANMPPLFIYANQVKPYELEALCSLLVLSVWWICTTKHLPWWVLALCWTVLALAGNPPCFLIGGCIAVDLVSALHHRDTMLLRHVVSCIALCGVLLGIYFWFWLRPVAVGDGMQGYWTDAMLPLPVTPARVRAFSSILFNALLVPAFGKRLFFLIPMLTLSFIVCPFFRQRFAAAVWMAFGGALVASCCHMFPVSLRLWIFAIPLFSLLACWAWCKILGKGVSATMLLLLFAFANLGVAKFRHPLGHRLAGEEINASLDYLHNHFRDGDSVYVFLWSTPAFKFKNGYDTSRFEPTTHDNIIWGGRIWADNEIFEHDLASVGNSSPCWLVAAHALENANEESVREFLSRLDASGLLVLKDNSFSTPLYWYDKNP